MRILYNNPFVNHGCQNLFPIKTKKAWADYKVVFVNGAKVEFAKNGEWKDVECKYGEVPAAIVPQQIRDYVTKNYPKNKIVAIDRDRRDYEVELDNGLDLKFDLMFRLIDIDN